MLAEPTCELGSIQFDVHANDHIDPPFSHLWYWGFMGILLVCLVRSIASRIREARKAREADAAVDESAPLTTGSRFVSGQVEFAQGSNSAVSVHVEQTGSETKTKNGWSHQWREIHREVKAQPFYLRRASGERIRVEPGKKPLLVDSPDRIVWKNREARTRVAELSPNEHVIVEGVLTRDHDPEHHASGDYRTVGQGWVMKPLRKRRMHLSAEKLGDRHRKRARAFGVAINTLFCALAWVMVLFTNYEARFFGGDDVCGEVVRKEIRYSKSSKGQVSSHHEVQLLVGVPSRPVLTQELDKQDWDNVTYGSILAFRYVPNRVSASSPGTGTSAHYLPIVFALLGVLLGVSTFSSINSYRRWYEGKLENNGSGQLPNSPTEM